MNIVCIAASQVPSATANSIQVMKACQALAQLGHAVRLLVPQAQKPGEPPPTADQLKAHYGLELAFPLEWLPANPRWKRYDFCWRAVQRAKALRADLVYIWPLQAADFALLARLPVMLEMHGPPEGALGPWLFRLFLKLPGRKRLLPITHALEQQLARAYHFVPSPSPTDHRSLITGHSTQSTVHSIISPNAIDLERYATLPSPAAARGELGLPEQFTVGYTGHLYPGRGMALLLELARRFPQLHFLWVGGHPEDVAQWQQRLASEHLDNVTLTGFIENQRLPRYQAAADLLLMPYERAIAGSSGGNSASYASPMKMFDYMACGRAILSSDLPVIREVLNEANAVLCPPEDPSAWAAALQSLHDDEPRRLRLAQQARQDVQQYTWQARAQRALAGWE